MSTELSEDIVSDSDDEKRDRRREMAQALAKGGMSNVQVISHESAREVLTPRRRELLRAIRAKEPESVRGLARLLERDPGQVSRDLETLAAHSVVTFEEEGRGKRPVVAAEHIVVEPVI